MTTRNDPQRFVDAYLAGRMTKLGVIASVPGCLTPENADAFLSECPPFVRDWLREQSARLPADDDDAGWGEVFIVQSVCEDRTATAEDRRRADAEDRRRLREGVRLLRLYATARPSSADPPS